MRLEDIRFKAKRLDNNQWVEGSLTILETTAFIHSKEKCEDGRTRFVPLEV